MLINKLMKNLEIMFFDTLKIEIGNSIHAQYSDLQYGCHIEFTIGCHPILEYNRNSKL